MTFKIENISADALFITASEIITADDYEKTLLPLFEKYLSSDTKVRVLMYFGKDFKGYSAEAAWEDVKFGSHYLRIIERCAVVTDVGWLCTLSHIIGNLIPCVIATYPNDQLSEAKQWLLSGEIALQHSLDKKNGVLNIEINAPISSINIETLSSVVDNYLENKGTLNGLVIHAKKFPGWENLGSMISHFRFVRDHHQKIKRVALVTDSHLAFIAQHLVKRFVNAKIKHFNYDQLEEADSWACGNG